MKLIFLIGMPGVGKTTIGKKIATELNILFFDLDEQIENIEKIRISDIFKTKGEPEFRKIEHLCLKNIVEQTSENAIIACGGGTPCYHNNIEIIKKNGTAIYLYASINWLLSNISKSNNRPLFNNKVPNKVMVQDLLEKRSAFYQQANIIVDIEDLQCYETLKKTVRDLLY